MSTLRFPPLANLVTSLRDAFNLKILIETGSYHGESTSFAANNFDQVVSIDINEEVQNIAIERCAVHDNVTFLLGDTRGVLPSVVEALDGPALFWLDAHSTGIFDGREDCPILEELDIINKSPYKHFILIDDAHCFKPPVPHDARHWPEISELYEKAFERDYTVTEGHDVLVFTPLTALIYLKEFIENKPNTNEAYALIDTETLRKRMPAHLLPTKMTCRAEVRHAPPPNAFEKQVKALGSSMTETVDTIYGRMLVPRFDINQTGALRCGFSNDQDKINILTDLIQSKSPGAVFLDIGANVGAFSFALRPYCFAVHAFEPQRLIFNMMCGSVAINGWENVYCYNNVISDTYRKVEIPQFDYNKKCNFGSIEFGPTQKEKLHQERGDNPLKREFVEAVPLDSFLFARIDVIKIDVEGMELEVLKGANTTITMHRPIIMAEYIKVDSEALKRKLISMGYDVKDIGCDFLAIPQGR